MASRYDYHGNVRAPEFPADLEWLNTGRRLSLAELRGKLVLLDFWTYGCINCMHIIPDLRRLEQRYPNELVVIGVHSAKFSNEGARENIRQIILRYDLEHPVVNDRDFRVWQAYAVRAWPTTVLIDPRGYVLAAHSGEGVLFAFGDMIEEALHRYTAEGVLDRTPLDLVLERSRVPETPLSFPGKVLADEPGRRLFIADSNHHRIVVTSLDGQVLDVIGSGQRAFDDGPYDRAGFSAPQGMALDGETLYVADTENHAIRQVDLRARTVSTLAGTGTMGYRGVPTELRRAQLNSPWDLVLASRRLFIAMAGVHQLWVLDLDAGSIGPYAGSGREGLLDGKLLQASLAQPSGITSDGRLLYFADSEASAVRSADLDPSGKVRTLIGEGLFEFGDKDGSWPKARLQHALGIAYHEGYLYLADTYNHKLKRLDLASGHLETLLGTGTPAWSDAPMPQFYEPGGLSWAGDKLYVADTNNHVIRIVSVEARTVETLVLRDEAGLLTPPSQPTRLEVLRLGPQRVRPGQTTLNVQLHLPEGYQINVAAPSQIAWHTGQDGVARLANGTQTRFAGAAPQPLELQLSAGLTVLRGDLAVYYCAVESKELCLIKLASIEVPLEVNAVASAQDIVVDIPLLPPQEHEVAA